MQPHAYLAQQDIIYQELHVVLPVHQDTLLIHRQIPALLAHLLVLPAQVARYHALLA